MDQTTALLYISTGCTHCGALMHLLSERLKQGVIARLEMINLSSSPEAATELNIQSVPCLMPSR